MDEMPSSTDASSDSPQIRDGSGGLLDPGGDRSFLVDAAIGAAVTIVLSFVPFSPLLGGTAAAYLHREDGPLVGAASGAVAALPAALFGLLALVFLGFGAVAFGGDALAGGVGFLLFTVLLLAVLAVFNALLGAIGGFVGVELARRYPDPPW